MSRAKDFRPVRRVGNRAASNEPEAHFIHEDVTDCGGQVIQYRALNDPISYGRYTDDSKFAVRFWDEPWA